jgi:hypothetical protein
MMSSEDIKEQLDEWLEDELDGFGYYNESDVEQAIGKLKRIKKSKNKSGQWERIFTNIYLNKKVLVVEEKIVGFIAEGDYVFHIDSAGDMAVGDYEYFKKKGYQSDWHLNGFVVFPEFVSEVQEGCFRSKKDTSETRKTMIEFGFVEDPKFSAFIESVRN